MCIRDSGDTEDAGAAVSGAIRAGLVPSLLEIMDNTCIRAVEAYTGSSILGDTETPAAILIGQSDVGGPGGRHEMDLLERVCVCLLYTSPSPRDGLLSR